MTPFRSAAGSCWQKRALFVLTGLWFVASAEAKPRPLPAAKSSAAKPAGAPGSSAATPPATAKNPEIADALPTNTPAAVDLYLNHDEERRADALAYFAEGQLVEDAADGDLALEKFKQAFERDPSNAELAVKLAFMLAARNDAPGGIQVLKDGVKWAPKSPLPLISLAQLYAKYLKKGEVALKYAEQAQALDPSFFPSTLAVYELATALGQTAKAQQTLQKAATSTSSDPQYWLDVAGLYAQTYLKDDGVASSGEALEQMNRLFRKAAALGKDQALLQAKVGNYFIDSRQVKDSIPYFREAIRLRQSNEEDPALLNAGDKLAAALAESGEKAEAIKVLEEVTKENPLRFESFEVLGKLYEESGDLDRALASYKQSLLIDTSEPQNHLRILRMQLRMKRYDDAVETAKLTRARFPGSTEAIYFLASALSQAKRHTEAMAVYAEAKHEFENGHEELLDANFFLSYGAAAEQAGLTDIAAELLRKSIDLDPNGAAQAYNYLGYMWVDRGEHLEEAGEMIKKALEMEPDNGAFLDSLGWFYYHKGDFQRAAQYLLKAEGVTKPEDSVVMEHLGDTYQQLGKAAQALQYWQKSLALDAENKKVSEKIEAAKQKVAAAPSPPATAEPANR